VNLLSQYLVAFTRNSERILYPSEDGDDTVRPGIRRYAINMVPIKSYPYSHSEDGRAWPYARAYVEQDTNADRCNPQKAPAIQSIVVNN